MWSTWKLLRFSWNRATVQEWRFQSTFPSPLPNATAATSAENEPPFYTHSKKQRGRKPCLFLNKPSSHSKRSGTPLIRDPLLSAVPWKSRFPACLSHLRGFRFLCFRMKQSSTLCKDAVSSNPVYQTASILPFKAQTCLRYPRCYPLRTVSGFSYTPPSPAAGPSAPSVCSRLFLLVNDMGTSPTLSVPSLGAGWAVPQLLSCPGSASCPSRITRLLTSESKLPPRALTSTCRFLNSLAVPRRL